MVFQSYALFPHLPVTENVAFGLRMRRIERSAMARQVAEALALVRLHHLGGRYPASCPAASSSAWPWRGRW
jgi:ABC-type Fe3+/spermidine/putrescine transport system ATPase subunit